MGRAGFNLLHVQYPLEAALQDGAGCGLGDDYEFVLRVPEHGPNHKDLVVEFLGGGAWVTIRVCSLSNLPFRRWLLELHNLQRYDHWMARQGGLKFVF